ncbi:HalOD1 output domain-containing protein [Halobaculum gomorrense]|uniref:Halobacterial output domain-containing protein n=1 Tax=Halobaculum gomorrense TaxID=43928 RepID=A0A1M5RNT2_9EURY|nr:HalOD1 output domain-containing protein [Halobaculum gomorrense]SHH27954.1 hypothetical protein SAMN05443636_2265 [Halobaculum gomorrense]
MTQTPTNAAARSDARTSTAADLGRPGVSAVASAIIGAVAEAEGVGPEAVDSTLHCAIDADAVAALLAHDATDWRLRFPLDDHDVTVRGEGTVVVDGRAFPNRF